MTIKFPVDVLKDKVIKTLTALGFRIVREGNHLALERENSDGTRTLLTMPNHPRIKASTLRTICSQAGISREEFIRAYERHA